MKRKGDHIILSALLAFILILPVTVSESAFGQKVKSDAKAVSAKAVKNVYLPGTVFPEQSKVVSARLLSLLIDLTDTLNFPLLLPEEPENGRSNLADLIFEAIRDSSMAAYSYRIDSVIPEKLSVNEASDMLSETSHVMVADNDGNISHEMIVRSDFRGSDVKRYYLRLAELYDSQGKLIGEIPVSLCPLLQKRIYDLDRVVHIRLFELSFGDKKFYDILSKNYTAPVKPGEPDSYLNFFTERKYSIARTDTISLSSQVLLKELGIR